jgi:thiosulfate/3-mercaptopyruvate sulfurtransferase
MKTKNIFNSLFIIFLFIGNIIAQEDLITAKEFKTLLKNTDNLTIIDASKSKLYKKAHLDGAINIPYKILNQKEGEVFGLLLSPEELATVFGNKGVSDQDYIVIYDEGSQKYSSRVYLVLKHLGAPNVKLLHKDNKAWRDSRLKLTSKPSKTKAKSFTVHPLVDDFCVDISYIESNLGNDNFVIIDARSQKEYTATQDEGKKKYSKGHLPGAININFKEFYGENKSFKSKEAIADLLASKGITPEKTYLFYCKTGVKASLAFVYFKNVLKFKNLKMYDGAYLEWEHKGKQLEK